MFTVIETPLFTQLWPDYWAEEDCIEFAAYLSDHPGAGDVIPQSGGCRKLRWARANVGKRGGLKVIYLNRLANASIVLLLIYTKNAHDNVSADLLRQIVKEI